jgi:hypothetical protein
MTMTERKKEPPYLDRVTVEKIWNPDYDQNATCKCGHSYERHFDSYESMANVGCKYCECRVFAAHGETEDQK